MNFPNSSISPQWEWSTVMKFTYAISYFRNFIVYIYMSISICIDIDMSLKLLVLVDRDFVFDFEYNAMTFFIFLLTTELIFNKERFSFVFLTILFWSILWLYFYRKLSFIRGQISYVYWEFLFYVLSGHCLSNLLLWIYKERILSFSWAEGNYNLLCIFVN